MKARIEMTLLVAFFLIGTSIAARNGIAQESAQARVQVDDGNRALAANERGKAVLAFERARLFAPRAAFVRSALARADVRDPQSIVPRVFSYITSVEWSALATGCGWIGGLAFAFVIARKRGGFLGRAAFASSSLFAVGMAALVLSNTSSMSVVMTPDEQARVAPYRGAAVEGELPQGRVVILGPNHGAFVHVRAVDGLEGWVRQSSLESVTGPPY